MEKDETYDIEEAILHAMVLDKNALLDCISSLKKEDFNNPVYSKFFKILHDLWQEGLSIDETVLKSQLSENLKQIFEEKIKWHSSNPQNYNVYINLLKNKSNLYSLLNIGYTICNEAKKPEADYRQVLCKAEQSLIDFSEGGKHGNFETPATILPLLEKKLEQRQKEGIVGISSGLKSIDELTGGFQNQDLIIVAGRPGVGKTSCVLHISVANFLQKIPVGIFSLEMQRESLVLRAISNISEIDGWKLRTGKVDSVEWGKYQYYRNTVLEAPLYVDDTPGLSISELQARAKRLKLQNPNLSLLVVDYLQLMGEEGGANREQQVSRISRGLKTLAKDLNIPIIAVSQLSRECERREDKRPILSDLRESGGLEQDADIVILMYRDYYYTHNEERKFDCELNLAKQRNGPTDMVECFYNLAFQKFYDKKEK